MLSSNLQRRLRITPGTITWFSNPEHALFTERYGVQIATTSSMRNNYFSKHAGPIKADTKLRQNLFWRQCWEDRYPCPHFYNSERNKTFFFRNESGGGLFQVVRRQ